MSSVTAASDTRRVQAKLILTEKDLAEAQRIAVHMLSEGLYNDGKLWSGTRQLERYVFTSMLVVVYARPHTESRRGSDRYFLKVDMEALLDEVESSLHRKLLTLRNKVFAHTDLGEYDAGLRVLNGGLFPYYSVPNVIHLGLSESDLRRLVVISSKVSQEVVRQRKELGE